VSAALSVLGMTPLLAQHITD